MCVCVTFETRFVYAACVSASHPRLRIRVYGVRMTRVIPWGGDHSRNMFHFGVDRRLISKRDRYVFKLNFQSRNGGFAVFDIVRASHENIKSHGVLKIFLGEHVCTFLSCSYGYNGALVVQRGVYTPMSGFPSRSRNYFPVMCDRTVNGFPSTTKSKRGF